MKTFEIGKKYRATYGFDCFGNEMFVNFEVIKRTEKTVTKETF